MTVVYDQYGVSVHRGDCRDILAEIPNASVHAVVTDPPYLLGFMGRGWDVKEVHEQPLWHGAWARECLRVLAPGGYLLAFGGSRTWHRLAVGIELVGFEIRDSIAWLDGSGFPKSLNVAKAILGGGYSSDESQVWRGWGTALKPAFEPIVVGRKPLVGTGAANVLEHGTGALNIDGCRIPAGQDYRDKCASVVGLSSNRDGDAYGQWSGVRHNSAHERGRWPPNAVLDGETAHELNRQCSDEKSRYFPVFHWEAKAPRVERPRVGGMAHPTVKPLKLMRWLVRLVTPPNGVVLDPFLGSGTTAHAARLEGF